MSKDVDVVLNKAGIIEVMRSQGVANEIRSLTDRAWYRAESVSGLKFGHGIDYGTRGKVRAVHGWVGARMRLSRHGFSMRRNFAKQVEALTQALHGI